MCADSKKKQAELIVAVRLGDDDACAELIRMYSPMIGGLVKKTMSQLPPSARCDEDELLQEAAIKLYQAALSFDLGGEITFGLYAKICVKNRMISLLRRYASEGENVTVELPEDILEIGDAGDPSLELIRTERERELEERIRAVLSTLEYDVYNLYVDGARSTEIADALSISIKTAENAVYRMKTKIGKLFT